MPPSPVTPPSATGPRTSATRTALQTEAARRAQTSEPLSAIAKALQVSDTTIYRWAARGGFRQIDRKREAAGLSALPVPDWAQRSYDTRRRTAPVPTPAPEALHAGRPAAAPATPETEDLGAEAALFAREALALVRAGKLKEADEKMRASDRLLRIQKRLALLCPQETAEKSPSQVARDRIEAMSDAELEEEILRLAGVGD